MVGARSGQVEYILTADLQEVLMNKLGVAVGGGVRGNRGIQNDSWTFTLSIPYWVAESGGINSSGVMIRVWGHAKPRHSRQ